MHNKDNVVSNEDRQFGSGEERHEDIKLGLLVDGWLSLESQL